MSHRFRSFATSVVLTIGATTVAAPNVFAYEVPCEPWGSQEIRCGTETQQSGSVHIVNRSTIPVTFKVSEWHSHCHWSGWWKGETLVRDLMPDNESNVATFGDPDPHLCRENFIYDCRLIGAGVDDWTWDCKSLLNVVYRVR